MNTFRAMGGKLVDSTPEVEQRFQAELDRVDRTYAVTPGEDFTKFPTFNFTGNIWHSYYIYVRNG